MEKNRMNKGQKIKAVERMLFAALLAALGAGGLLYEVFRTEAPEWQLVSLIVAGMSASYAAYRLALSFAVRKLGS